MKNRICLILVFLVSFFIGSTNSYGKQGIGINNIESKINKISDFKENGVMIKYKTNKPQEEELKSIRKNIWRKYSENCSISDNEISFGTSTSDIQAYVWKEEGETSVELKVINYDKEKGILSLMKELTELQTKNIFDIRYFQYIKGKVNNIDDTLRNVENIQEITNINTLEIHNGYVGTADIYNGERVNFAVSTYDTGAYLIIGTPVIFATY